MSKLNSFMIDCVYATSAALTVRRNVGNTFLFAVDFCCPHSIQRTHTQTHTYISTHPHFILRLHFVSISIYLRFLTVSNVYTTFFDCQHRMGERQKERGSRSEREREGEAAACRRCIELSLNYAAVQSYGLSFFGFNSVCFVCVLKRSAAISKLPQNEAQIDRQTD